MRPETILCIEEKFLGERLTAKGFVSINEANPDSLLVPEYLWFIPRILIEHRQDFRQIIPYIILHYDDAIVLYERTPKSSEERLHGLLSIGFGGHVRLTDIVFDNEFLDVGATLSRAVYRELEEEVRHSVVKHREPVGMICDDADTVSRVHLGVVELWTLSDLSIASVDPSICECKFVSLDELSSYEKRMENWSRLCTTFLVNSGFLEKNKLRT